MEQLQEVNFCFSFELQCFCNCSDSHLCSTRITDRFQIFFSRFFEDEELLKDKDSTKYRFKKDGKKHTLIIQEATLADIGMYHAWTNGGHTKGELEVEGIT